MDKAGIHSGGATDHVVPQGEIISPHRTEFLMKNIYLHSRQWDKSLDTNENAITELGERYLRILSELMRREGQTLRGELDQTMTPRRMRTGHGQEH